MITQYKIPSDADLWWKAIEFYRTSKKATYDAMRLDGSLTNVVGGRVAACKRYAQNLIDSGTWEGEAWNQAIRVELLGSESN